MKLWNLEVVKGLVCSRHLTAPAVKIAQELTEKHQKGQKIPRCWDVYLFFCFLIMVISIAPKCLEHTVRIF